MYQRLPTAMCVCAILLTTACTGMTERSANRSQAQASRAQGAVAQERLNLVEQYRTCVSEAGDDVPQIEACDVYLRSAEALS